jgi:hypothetical protein
VLAVTVVPGLGIRYNLTVKDLHTFMVGDGQWVVHNCNPAAKAALDVAKSIYSELGPRAFQDTGKFLSPHDTTIAIGVLNDGSKIGAINAGTKPEFLNTVLKLFEENGIRNVGPSNLSQLVKGGTHAEMFILEHVGPYNEGKSLLKGISSYFSRPCPSCEPVILEKYGYPLEWIGR